MSTPSTPANDASAAFEWARLEEERATGDALTELAYQEYDEDPFTPLSEPSASPATPGTPATPEANTGDPAASQTPSDNEPAEDGEGEEETPIFDGLDTIASAIRGVVQGPLDLADNVGDAINSVVGEPLMRLMTLGASEEIKEAAMESLRKQGPSGREILEERYGAPESLTGMLAQGMTSQLVFIIPGTRALKATGMGTFAANTAASAATAAGTSREGDGNLSTLATTMGQGNVLFDNPLTRTLAVDADDATWERLLKITIEDIGLSFVSDGAIAVAARLFRKVRKTVPEIEGVAARDPEIVTDPELGETAMRGANARVKKAVLDETVAQADEAAAGAREAGEFRGDDAGAPDPALDEAAAMTQNELTTAREALQQEIDEADAALAEMAQTTEADGRYVEAYRQMMRDILDGEVNQALGDAATRNMPARPPEPQKTKLGNFLEANEGTLDALHYAYETGDVAELERLFGAVYDNTNYNNITAEGGVAELIEAQGAIFGNSTASPRVQTTWGLVDVGESTVADLEEMVTNAGGSMNALEQSLAQLGADVSSSIKDFRVKFNQLRAAEVSVASRLATLLDQWEQVGPGGASDQLRVEILQTHELAAHLTEIRSGGSSEIAGALGDHRLTFEPLDFDALLDVDRAARSEELAAHVAKNGGAGKIDPMIEALLHSRRAGVDALLDTNAGAKHAITLGDLAYEAFISNILSSPTTQAINISSNAMRSVAWDPTSKFFAASGRALIAQDLTGFKALRGHIEGLIAGTTGAFKYDAALGGSRLATAWRRGERVTGRPGGLFAEATTRPDRSLLNTRGLSRFVRDGASVRLPFTRALGAGKHGDGINLPLMPLPKSTRNSMADWIATRTGPVSRAVNYMGSAMGWIGRSLAVGDELFAGMAYRAQLYADAVEVAVGEGLTGAELAKRVDFIRRMSPQIDLLRKRAKMVDPGTRANLNQLAEIHHNASKYAERATYATQNDATRFLEKAKNVVPGFRWFAPFVRTPLNLAEQGVVDFSPLGPAAKAFMAIPEAARGDRKAIGEALGRLGMVGGIYGLVWKMAEDGAFTGGGPHNPAEREVWLLNNRPYSFKLNGEWYSYNRFDPIAMPLGILADMMYLNGRTPDGQVENKLHEQAIMVLMNAVKSRTFLQGIAEIAHIMQTPQSTWAQSLMVSKLQNTLIPGSRMWATLEKGGIPMPEDLRVAITEGEVEGGLLGDFLNGRPEKQLVDMRNPVVHFGTATARDLPAGIQEGFVQLWNSVFSAKNAISMVPDRDFFGEVRVTPEGMGPDFLSPFQVLPDGDDPVADELARLGYGHSNRERFGKLYGLELTPEQRDRFHRYFVKPTKDTKSIREALEDLMLDEDGNLSEAFQSLGDPITLELGEQRGGKLEAIDKVVGRYMKAAKKQMLKNDEDVRKAYTEKRRAGILARGQKGTERLRAEREEAEANDTSSLFRALDGGV